MNHLNSTLRAPSLSLFFYKQKHDDQQGSCFTSPAQNKQSRAVPLNLKYKIHYITGFSQSMVEIKQKLFDIFIDSHLSQHLMPDQGLADRDTHPL